MREIEDDLEQATADVSALCDEVIARVVASEELLEKLRIPRHAWSLVADSHARARTVALWAFRFRL